MHAGLFLGFLDLNLGGIVIMETEAFLDGCKAEAFCLVGIALPALAGIANEDVELLLRLRAGDGDGAAISFGADAVDNAIFDEWLNEQCWHFGGL